MNDGDNPMSIEEAKRHLEAHHDEIMQKAERQTLNYLATQRAQELAAESLRLKDVQGKKPACRVGPQPA